MLCMVPSWLSPVCSELLSSVGPMPWFSDEHFSLAQEYGSCVIIETSWVQSTGEEQRASRMPVELCLCFQEIDLRALMRLALRIVNYVGRRLRRQIPSLWEMRPKGRHSITGPLHWLWGHRDSVVTIHTRSRNSSQSLATMHLRCSRCVGGESRKNNGEARAPTP